MVESKAWEWKALDNKAEEYWREPSIESYYLLHKWKKAEFNNFFDLGCGLGRHSILFAANGFNVKAFDLSKDAIISTKEWAESLNLEIECQEGDMLKLPYKDEEFECIYCKNVISHTDTMGIRKIIEEIKRVMKKDGECYLTLGSKETWGFKQEDWPLVDPNTRIRMDDGPEKGIPHFYADYNLIIELFKDFEIELVQHIQDFYESNGKINSSYHYHVLIKKI